MKISKSFYFIFLVSFIAIQGCDIEALFKNDNYGCTEIDEYKFYRWQNPEVYGGSSNLVGHLQSSDQKHTCTFELIMDKVCVGEPINLNLRLVYYSQYLTKIGLSRSDLAVLGTYELYTKDDDWGNPFFKEEIPKAQITQDTHVWDIVMGLLEEAGDEQVVNMVIRIELSFPADNENDPNGNNGYLFYDIIQNILLEARFSH